MNNKKKIIFLSLFQVLVYLVEVYLLSHKISLNKINLSDSISLFKFNEFLGITFNEAFDLINIIIYILIPLCTFSLFNYIASASEKTIEDTINYIGYFLKDLNDLNNLNKNYLFWIIAVSIYIFLILSEAETIFLFFCTCLFLILSYLNFKKIIMYIKNEKTKYCWKFTSSIKQPLVYITSVVISILLTHSFKEVLYFPLFVITIYFMFYMINFLVVGSKKMLFADYYFAKSDKRKELNTYIINLLFNKYKVKNSNSVKYIVNQTLLFKDYSLDKKNDFELLLIESNFSPKVKEELNDIYDKIVIEYIVTSNLIAEVIILRNNKNLLVSILFIPAVLLTLKFANSTIFEFNNKLILGVLFVVLLYRLLIRSLEIAIAFYKDIKPNVKLKRSNLSNNKRMRLVLNSLLEVTILSGLLYTLIGNFIKIEGISTFSIFYDAFTHSLATAAFNTSFPFDSFSLIKLNECIMKPNECTIKPNDAIYEYPVTKLFSWMTMIQLIHLIQLIMSVVLISLSITSYGSKNSDRSLYIFKLKDNKYQFLESSIDGKIEKLIYEKNEVNSLINQIELDWENNKFDFLQYEKIQESINLHLLKK